MRTKLLSFLALLLLIALGVFFFILPTQVDRSMNTIVMQPPYQAAERAKALHQRLFMADLHDYALMWNRDLLRRYDYGHADLPRLQEGRVTLQVFATVTKSARPELRAQPVRQRHHHGAGDGAALAGAHLGQPAGARAVPECQRRFKSDPLTWLIAEVNLTHPGSIDCAARARRA
jgi:hypothetical protein